MCPSYMVTRDEQHSTRGRAHLLFEMLRGETITTGWESDEVKSALDLCLACKACWSECPVSVDMATYKAEFLADYYGRRWHPLRHHLFGHIDWWRWWHPGCRGSSTHSHPSDRSYARFSLLPESHRNADFRGSRRRPSNAGWLGGARAGRSGGNPVVGHVHELLLPAGRTGGGSRSGTSGIPRDRPPADLLRPAAL